MANRRSTAGVLTSIVTVAAACASAPRNPVLDKRPAGVEGHTTVTYYDVHGRTYAELHADMRRLGPKNNGSSFVGETRSPMSWSWRTESVTGGSCSLRDIRVAVNSEILLPRWTPPAGVDSSLVTEWNRFLAALELHEAGHKDISARAGRDLKDQLRSLSGLCSQVSMRANDIARQIIDKASEDQRRYDAETQHGLTQGTGFGPQGVRMTIGPNVAIGTPDGAVPTAEERRRLMDASRAHADSVAERVATLVVSPRVLQLSVGQTMYSSELFRRLDVRGVTAQGDTVTDLVRTLMLEPNTLLVRTNGLLRARGAGDVNLWVFPGSRSFPELVETASMVRVVIHIR